MLKQQGDKMARFAYPTNTKRYRGYNGVILSILYRDSWESFDGKMVQRHNYGVFNLVDYCDGTNATKKNVMQAIRNYSKTPEFKQLMNNAVSFKVTTRTPGKYTSDKVWAEFKSHYNKWSI
tara:strand:- start:239 stop:601 length:363 start_codon:yes stop_codon:yes gene_type:complete